MQPAPAGVHQVTTTPILPQWLPRLNPLHVWIEAMWNTKGRKGVHHRNNPSLPTCCSWLPSCTELAIPHEVGIFVLGVNSESFFYFPLLNGEIPFQREEKKSCVNWHVSPQFGLSTTPPSCFSVFWNKRLFQTKNIKTCHSNPVNFQILPFSLRTWIVKSVQLLHAAHAEKHDFTKQWSNSLLGGTRGRDGAGMDPVELWHTEVKKNIPFCQLPLRNNAMTWQHFVSSFLLKNFISELWSLHCHLSYSSMCCPSVWHAHHTLQYLLLRLTSSTMTERMTWSVLGFLLIYF